MRNDWPQPPQHLRLHAGEVHVWRAELAGSSNAAVEPRLKTMLSREEHLRASRYHSAGDGYTYLLGRAVLRQILSSYLDAEPAELSFSYSAHGKPALANAGAEWLRFNVSHSNHLALYAVARDRSVGIDIEQLRPEIAIWQLATAFFAPREIQALRRLGDELRTEAFYACWTRKEAYLKAKGSGLSAWLDSFEVPVDPNGGFERLLPVTTEDGEWSLRSLDAGPGFAAACAAEGQQWNLKLWEWPSVGELRSQAA